MLTTRRDVLGAGLAGAAGLSFAIPARGAGTEAAGTVALRAPQPMARLHTDADGTLLGLSSSGMLWRYAADAWHRIGEGLDPESPLAHGHGRLAGRGRDGGLWLLESDRVSLHTRPALAPNAGLLVLALAVIAIGAARDGRHHVVRLEAGAGGWAETARSKSAVLPDARPVQFDPAGTANDDDGHVAVFAGPDSTRYRHGVLGDDIEATSVLLLERHDLQPMAQLDLPAPFVFEDIAPRPIAWQGGRGLLTVRSGPRGAQMAIVAAARGNPDRLALAALGEPIGSPQRWLSPTTDGVRLLAVHTPHLGGVLHRYRADGDRLAGHVITGNVTNHMIGRRDLDMSAWVGQFWAVPAQDRGSVRFVDLDSMSSRTQPREVTLDSPAVGLQPLRRNGQPGVAVLQQRGSVVWASASPFVPDCFHGMAGLWNPGDQLVMRVDADLAARCAMRLLITVVDKQHCVRVRQAVRHLDRDSRLPVSFRGKRVRRR